MRSDARRMGACIRVPILPSFRCAGTRRAFDIQIFKFRLRFVKPEAAASIRRVDTGFLGFLPKIVFGRA